MSPWGRKEYPNWPSRFPVWQGATLLLAVLVFAAGVVWQYQSDWTFLQRFYLATYLQSGVTGSLLANHQARYALINVVDAKGKARTAVGDEVQGIASEDGTPRYALTESAQQEGLVRLAWDDGLFKDRPLHAYLGHWIYQDQTFWSVVKAPTCWAASLFLLGMIVAVPKDRKRSLILKYGRRLRGPELMRTSNFNEKLGKNTVFTVTPPDGLAFINEEQSWTERTFQKELSRWVRLPREREAMHLLVMGDSGHGKSAIIRQALSQIWERGETAIVYDPALEYLPQFYQPSRGDVILNPLDGRCPFWTPSDEVTHPAEALTVAASLFPDQGKENRFFVDAPRKIFAHLLNLKPTPEELTYWLSHPEEIDRRVEGTELQAMINPHAGPQRSGVLGSLGMVGDALRLLPAERETSQRWSTAQWAKERKGWIFLTSRPTVREQLRPLMSLWIDLLVLRLMNEGQASAKKTWFVLDELASLQRLPQLLTAITEGRKANSPMILGFQGKSQIEALYGQVAEVMLSQPMTKIFLKTSEPNAADWVAKAIGDVEIERYRETRTHGHFPKERRSDSRQREISREPLVMPSEVSGLDPLHAYLKHGNYVVRIQVPYLTLDEKQPKFMERKAPEKPVVVVHAEASIKETPKQTSPEPQLEQEPVQAMQQRHFE